VLAFETCRETPGVERPAWVAALGAVADLGTAAPFRELLEIEARGVAWLIRFASPAQVHPLVAIRWSRRLAPAIVLAANDGFLPGRVNFAVRSASAKDLLKWLRGLPFTPSPQAEYANGHARATGGSLPTAEFVRFPAILHALAASAARTHGT
jgi:hypothetical protein